jgi:prepilin-type processing-associated H-X9-DG protein
VLSWNGWGSYDFDPNYRDVDDAGIISGAYILTPGACVHNCTSLDSQPHSFHSGGVQYAMADGSVRMIGDGIDRDNFRRLVWIADREVITWTE